MSSSSFFHAQEKHYWRSLGDPTENTMALISDPRDETVAVLFYIYRYRRQKCINPCNIQANYRTRWLGSCSKEKSLQFSADTLNTVLVEVRCWCWHSKLIHLTVYPIDLFEVDKVWRIKNFYHTPHSHRILFNMNYLMSFKGWRSINFLRPLWDFSPVWTVICRVRPYTFTKALPHSTHLCGLSSEWIAWCRTRHKDEEKHLGHFSHL